MNERRAARVLVLDQDDRILLFKFEEHQNGVLPRTFWATPGGALDTNESYEDGSKRELLEETGIRVNQLGAPIAEQIYSVRLPDIGEVVAHERFFALRIHSSELTLCSQTASELDAIAGYKWWRLDELLLVENESIFPEDLPEILSSQLKVDAERLSSDKSAS